MRRAVVRLVLILGTLGSLFETHALSLNLEAHETRCLSENAVPKALLTGHWKLDAATAKKAHLQLTAPTAPTAPTPQNAKPTPPHVLFQSRELAGHFSVQAADGGEYKVCIANEADDDTVVDIKLQAALTLETHGELATKKHVEAISAALDVMEEISQHVHSEMLWMRERADEMQEMGESTRGRLLWVELAMMLTLLLMGLWQITYLKNFFVAKKIL